MAAYPSTRLVLFAKPRKDGTFSVALRVTYQRKSKFFFLNRHCSRADWDEKSGRFQKSFPGYKQENDILLTYERRASDALRAMERDGIAFSFDRFERAVFADVQTGGTTTLVGYISSIVDDLTKAGNAGNAAVYHGLHNAVRQFKPRSVFSDMDTGWLSRFEKWMTVERKTSGGGLSVYMRTLRAVCKRAIKEGLMPEVWYPFRAYSLAHLKSGKAKKSAGLEFVRALEGFVPVDAIGELARDLFLFSFYLRGMNLADIAELTAANIQGGRVVYTRKKTGRVYSVALSEKAAAIAAKYAGKTGFIFPIYPPEKKTGKQLIDRRKHLSAQINAALREIAAALGYSIPGLSFYTARHTYADSLKKAGVSVEVISQALGHADVRTTDNYLKSFGDDVLDEADKLLG